MNDSMRVTKFHVENKSGTKFAVCEITTHRGSRLWRVGNYTVGFDTCHNVWRVFDWSRDQDVACYDSRTAAFAYAREKVARSRRQAAAAITA